LQLLPMAQLLQLLKVAKLLPQHLLLMQKMQLLLQKIKNN
jgi:hypothetical protein